MDKERLVKYEAFVKEDQEYNNGRLVNCCDELSFMLDNPDVSEIVSKHALNEILNYATTFSDFYKKYKGYRKLEDFPIVDKEILKAHWDEIAIKEYCERDDSKIKFTSGSTGTPFKMIMDKYKHCRWIAGNKVFRDKVGVPSHTKTVFISETVADKNISKERMEKDNVFYKDCKYFDDNSLKELLCEFKNEKVKTFTTLASLLDRIAQYVCKEGTPKWDGEMKAIFSVSETLKENTRKIISNYFNCPVYVFYANEENGVLAVEDGSGQGCLANTVDFRLEVLSLEEDKPVKEGEVGRLVITDYYNKAFPIIRYENGDLVSIKRGSNGKLYINEIVGRKADVLYTTDGRMVHYFNGISFLEPFMDIKQFQLIQKDYQHFKWILNTENHSYEEFITTQCKKLFGEDSVWEFEYVQQIPKLRSGKTRMTVCLIKDKN